MDLGRVPSHPITTGGDLKVVLEVYGSGGALHRDAAMMYFTSLGGYLAPAFGTEDDLQRRSESNVRVFADA